MSKRKQQPEPAGMEWIKARVYPSGREYMLRSDVDCEKADDTMGKLHQKLLNASPELDDRAVGRLLRQVYMIHGYRNPQKKAELQLASVHATCCTHVVVLQ